MNKKLFGGEVLHTIVASVHLRTCKDSEIHFCECQGSPLLPLRSRYLCLTCWVLYVNLWGISSCLPAARAHLGSTVHGPTCRLSKHNPLCEAASGATLLYQGILWAVKSQPLEFSAYRLPCQWTSCKHPAAALTIEESASIREAGTFHALRLLCLGE